MRVCHGSKIGKWRRGIGAWSREAGSVWHLPALLRGASFGHKLVNRPHTLLWEKGKGKALKEEQQKQSERIAEFRARFTLRLLMCTQNSSWLHGWCSQVLLGMCRALHLAGTKSSSAECQCSDCVCKWLAWSLRGVSL